MIRRSVVVGGWIAGLMCLGFSALAAEIHADARSDYFGGVLRESPSFRLRAQAALSLGRMSPSSEVVSALSRALTRDRSAAVRSAAATALGRLGERSAIGVLRRGGRDRDSGVAQAARAALASLERAPDRGGPVGVGSRYYVGVGATGAANSSVGPGLLSTAADFLRGRVGAIDGVVLAPPRESSAQVRRALRSRSLAGYFIDSSVVRVEDRDGGVRVEVSLIVNTYPGRDMRAILNGSATVRGSTGERARRRAMEGAFTGALRRLPQALAAADARGGG